MQENAIVLHHTHPEISIAMYLDYIRIYSNDDQ